MNSEVEAKISSVTVKLESDIKAKLQPIWIKECVQFFLSENPYMPNDKLYENVKDQFVLANLSDTSKRVIPEMFSSKKEAWMFKETILLQMQQIVDICKFFSYIDVQLSFNQKIHFRFIS